MKKLFLLVSLFLLTVMADAQENSWKIKLNNKILVATTKENEAKNSHAIKAKEWKKSGSLQIQYTEADTTMWWRSFVLNDEDGNEILRKDSTTSYTIKLEDLRKFFNGKREIRIYLGGSPKDPNLAVRMRLVHLCTLRLQ